MERPSTRPGDGQAKIDSEASQPTKLIIQCPSCQTRFSIAKATLEGLDTLRFHCSKCDNVFSKAVDELQPATPKASDIDRSILTPQKVAREIVKEVVPSPAAAPAPLTESPPEFKTPLEQPTAIRNFTESPPKVLPVAPLEPPTIVSKQSEGVSAFDSTDNFKLDDSTYQTSFKFVESKPGTPVPPTKAGTSPRPRFDTEPNLRSALSETPRLNSDWGNDSGVSDDWQLGDRYVLTKHAGFSGFALLVAPLVGFLIILGGLGFYLGSNPQLTQDLLLSAIPSLPVAPPDGLHIENASFESVKLENGEEVRLVSGKITNGTLLAFEDVKLEAHAFDKSGNIIDRATTGSGTSLAETRVKSLSREMISELQSEEVRDRTILKPGESREFSIALLDRSLSKAAFFSARIYSVRQNEL